MPLRIDIKCNSNENIPPSQISAMFKQALIALFPSASISINTTARDSQQFRNQKIQLMQAEQDVKKRKKLGAYDNLR